MDNQIFNINDLTLLIVTIECFIFAFLLFSARARKISNLLLAIFLISVGLDTIDTLIYWCKPINHSVYQISPYIFLMLKFSVLVSPPALYLYTKSIVNKNYQFSTKELFHFLPAIAFPITAFSIFTSMGKENYYLSASNFDLLFYNPFFQIHLWMRNILCITYAVLGYRLLKAYQLRLLENYSNIEGMEHKWLKLLLDGYLLIWCSIFLAYICHIIEVPARIGNITGLITNYCIFIFLNTIVFYCLNLSNIFEGVKSDATEKAMKEKEVSAIDERHIAAVTESMIDDQLFLDPEITLKQLSKHLSLSERCISNVINRHFEKNFFEFINFYRIEHAKKIMAANTSKKISLLDVMADSGFNSKSVFNRYFKKYVEETPTTYRKNRSPKIIEN